MRPSLLRERIEIWDSKITVNNFGVNEEQKELFLACPAAVKHIRNDNINGTTKGSVKRVEFTIRFNRYFKAPNKSMYIIWDGQEWDIDSDNYFCSFQKYITLPAVKRSK